MARQYTVSKETTLLPFLLETLVLREGWTKKTVKQRLQNAAISVNARIQTQHNYQLRPEDIVSIGASPHGSAHPHSQRDKLDILYQDKSIIAINKPAGLLSVATSKEKKTHALALLRTQISRKGAPVKLWPVHRLDRDTSGVLLFATSKKIREAVMDTWENSQKIYLTIVEGTPNPQEGTITQPLRIDKEAYYMHVGAHKHAKHAVTHYKLLEINNNHSLLEVRLETGRQHQIRAHMAWMGHAVIGDRRYGSKALSARNTRMGLHATKLCFTHPVTHHDMTLEVAAPPEFYYLMG